MKGITSTTMGRRKRKRKRVKILMRKSTKMKLRAKWKQYPVPRALELRQVGGLECIRKTRSQAFVNLPRYYPSQSGLLHKWYIPSLKGIITAPLPSHVGHLLDPTPQTFITRPQKHSHHAPRPSPLLVLNPIALRKALKEQRGPTRSDTRVPLAQPAGPALTGPAGSVTAVILLVCPQNGATGQRQAVQSDEAYTAYRVT